MKIRLTGTRAETAVTVELLREVLGRVSDPVRYRIREVSRFYPNRGDSQLGRVYIDTDIDDTTPGAARRDRKEIR